jgi:hypothetical protein
LVASFEHVPPHVGHGFVTPDWPRNTTVLRLALIDPDPRSTFAVPEIGSEKRLSTQAGVPPEDSGNGAPK